MASPLFSGSGHKHFESDLCENKRSSINLLCSYKFSL